MKNRYKGILSNEGRYFPEGVLPRSIEEALANPIKVVGLHWNKDHSDFWVELNRPQSLRFDSGIDLTAPVCSGELICTLD